MKHIEKNLDNMKEKKVDKFNPKVRAIILNSSNEIIITKYADIFMFPGGKLDKDEDINDALVREIIEELGIDLDMNDTHVFADYTHFIENYPIVCSNEKENELNKTIYFLIKADVKYDKDKVSLTEREKKNGFEVINININDAIDLINNYKSNNPRYEWFKDEIINVLEELIKYLQEEKIDKYNNMIKYYKASEKLIDMHIHSLYSDGELSPNELVELAIKSNVGTMAITDHDTVNGLKNLDRNNSLIVDSGINIIDGIELSAKVDKGIMHILGYGIDKDNEILNKRLNEIKDINVNSVLSVIEMLKRDYNIYFTYEELKELINSNHNLGRPDVARLLMKNGYAKTVQEAFDKYLTGIRAKLGNRVKGIPYEECIDLILKSGGIPVLAHPKTLKLDDKELRNLVNNMKSIGLNGLEVYHSIHSDEERENYLNIANDYDLLISGGTDYHGPINKPNIKLGSGENNNIKIKKLTLLDELNKRY